MVGSLTTIRWADLTAHSAKQVLLWDTLGTAAAASDRHKQRIHCGLDRHPCSPTIRSNLASKGHALRARAGKRVLLTERREPVLPRGQRVNVRDGEFGAGGDGAERPQLKLGATEGRNAVGKA